MPVEAQLTQLVQTQQIRFRKSPLQFPETVIVAHLAQLGGQRRRVFEQDIELLRTLIQPQSNGEMCLASSWVADMTTFCRCRIN